MALQSRTSMTLTCDLFWSLRSPYSDRVSSSWSANTMWKRMSGQSIPSLRMDGRQECQSALVEQSATRRGPHLLAEA